MVCPMCITAAISQAAVPVASAVGGAIAARTALNNKKSTERARAPVRITAERSTASPVLQSIESARKYHNIKAPARLKNHDEM